MGENGEEKDERGRLVAEKPRAAGGKIAKLSGKVVTAAAATAGQL